ncbi:MAG: glycoside hydrolase family 16 protein [Bacteroidales bacterium]|nr:glycoside hydrolase family 16 protein [Bacteroidales bacterium]
MNKRNTIIAITTFLIIGLAACTGTAKEDAEKYRKGWSLVWEDNMDTPLDRAVWSTISRGDLAANRYMSDNEALYVPREGNLILRGVENSANNGELPFLTGGISREGVSPGSVRRIEVRARVNPAAGAVPYISLVPTSGAENITIDLMEAYGMDNFVYQSITSEYTTTQGMPDNPPSSALVGVNPNQFHVYAVEKYPDSLVFYVDETRTRKYPRILTDIPGQFPFNNLEFNLHIGVRVNRDARPEDMPADMFIDWVRIYEQKVEESTE